ncbi:zinc ribbon domain-containing protein [Methanosphaera sp.]|jgi:hypothetical protein|uniref:zinc ribbon domain-containing protein n=1 Tax=Methanosphaera sp. TaxID=2666342 RepID=UPI003D92AF95
MVKCKYCGYENVEGSKYCMHCSKALFSQDADFNIIIQEDNQKNNDLRDLYYSFLSNNFMNDDYIKGHNSTNTDSYYPDSYYTVSKKQFIATLLSALFTGIGYFYIHKLDRGLVFLASQLFLLFFTIILFNLLESYIIVYMMFLASLLVYIIGICDTYRQAMLLD